MGQRLLWISIAWLSLAGSSSPARPVVSLPQANWPSTAATKALEESYALSSSELDDDLDRVEFLNDLIIVAPDIDPGKVRIWADELIDKTQTIQALPGWSRIAYQKNAAVAVSKIDPVAGMQLFAKIGKPEPFPDQTLPEDVRAFGARTLFLNYFKLLGPKSFLTLKNEAIRLAQTGGSYPFHAISMVIPQLPETGKEGKAQADDLFTDAVKHYDCNSKVEDQHLEFFTLLQNVKTTVSTGLLQGAIQTFVSNVQNPNCDKRPITLEYRYVASIKTSEGPVKLSDESQALLFRAFSLIKEIHPQLAAKLQQENTYLAKADAPINYFAATLVPVHASDEEQAESEANGLQQALMRGIRNMRDSNPNAALQMAESIVNPPLAHTAAVAAVLSSQADWNAVKAKRQYVQVLDDLNSLPDSPTKPTEVFWRFEASLGLAQAAYKFDDVENFQYLASELFANGVQAFEADYAHMKDSAMKPADARDGYRELGELIEFAAAHNITWLLDEAQQMNDHRLHVHLLMYIAKGLAHQT